MLGLLPVGRTSLLLMIVLALIGRTVLIAQAGAIPVGGNVVITDAGLNGNTPYDPDIVVQGNTVYAVWGDGRDDDAFGSFRQVFFAKSTDGGVTWGSNVRVGRVDYDDWTDHPQIAVAADGTIWIVWYLFYQPESNQTNEIRIAKSTDGGQSFTVQTVVDGFPGAEDRWRPHIAVDEATGNLLLLYNEYWQQGSSTGYDLYVTVFDAGLNKLAHSTINDSPRSGRIGEGSQDDGVPLKSFAAHNGKVCAAWEDQRNRFAIWGACSSDGGRTFGPNFPISGADVIEPRLALGPDGTLYVIYAGKNDARKNILFSYSTDSGATWQPPLPVTSLTSDEVTAWDLAVDANSQVVVAWVREVGFRVTDLYLSTSLDSGVNWSFLPVEDGTGRFLAGASQWQVAVAVGGSGVNTTAHMAWKDDRNSDREIFGGNFVLDGIPPTAPANLQAVGSDTSNLLTWEAATDANGVQGYRVYRSTTPGGPYTEITPRLVPNTRYRDVGLDATLYQYRVAAVDNTANTGPISNEASAQAQVATNLPVSGVIAYEVGNQLRLRNFADLAAERVFGEGRRPRFSPDGTRLYYEVTETISSQAVAGGDTRIIYTAPELFNDYDIASFDPTDNANNEKYLAAIIGRSIVQVGGGFCYVGEPHYIVSTQKRYVDDYNYSSEVALSSFPQWLLFRYIGFCNAAGSGSTSPGDLCIVNLTNNEQKCLAGADYRDPDFAPARGDNRVVFAAPFTGQYEIWTARVDDNGNFQNYVQLTRGPAGVISRAPNWSSDGNWIIFTRDVDPSQLEDLRLHIVRADGSGLRNLAIAGEAPAWTGGGSPASPGDLTPRLFLPVVRQ
jgi:hypothetical protein